MPLVNEVLIVFTQHRLQKLMSTNKINVFSIKNYILITVA